MPCPFSYWHFNQYRLQSSRGNAFRVPVVPDGCACIHARGKRWRMRNIVRLTTYSALCGVFVFAAFDRLHASDKKNASIASGRIHDLSISIVNDSGKFVAGSNTFCAEFTKAANAEPVLVKDVEVEFAQQVGKIRERPTRALITESEVGRFCGNVDLGKQYYQPAFYYVYIRYTDTSGTRKKCNLSFAIKH
jgi:hypothetical protein